MNKCKYYIYAHGGSGNHGCEAIVRTTATMLKDKSYLFSFRPGEDYKYGVSEILTISKYSKNVKTNYPFLYYPARIWKLLFKKSNMFEKMLNRCIVNEGRGCKIALSVGGDNYCYGEPVWLMEINRALCKMGKKTVLWGCSIEPELLKLASVREDLERYSLIIARESITYNALREFGISTKIRFYPDPAFSLPVGKAILPASAHGYIGINFSNYILKTAKNPDLAYKCIEHTIEYILSATSYDIAFIPHVVWEGKSDLDLLYPLYKKYYKSGRVYLVEDSNCCDLKATIAQCKFFIGARTHATIAAYSTMVPTLVIGYSVKAKGIARDLFGTEKGYVLSAESIDNIDDITKAFLFIKNNEEKIRAHYRESMKSYISKAYKAANDVVNLLGE